MPAAPVFFGVLNGHGLHGDLYASLCMTTCQTLLPLLLRYHAATQAPETVRAEIHDALTHICVVNKLPKTEEMSAKIDRLLTMSLAASKALSAETPAIHSPTLRRASREAPAAASAISWYPPPKEGAAPPSSEYKPS